MTKSHFNSFMQRLYKNEAQVITIFCQALVGILPVIPFTGDKTIFDA
jgi:hypothetical protein